MKSLNIFGEMQEMDDSSNKGYVQKAKKSMGYRSALTKTISCKTCKHCLKMEHHSKTYYKCELIGTSNSEATDIRLKMVCNRHESE